jgi:uncharacterized membrane protein
MAVLKAIARSFRTRIFGGLLLVLPIVITIATVYWAGEKLYSWIIYPGTGLLVRLLGVGADRRPAGEPANGPAPAADALAGLPQDLPLWYEVAASGIVVLILFLLLYLAGMFVGSRLRDVITWIFHRLPLISSVYKAVSGVFEAIELQQKMQEQQVQRVVLIEFPHPGAKCPAFVTNSCRDEVTGRKILCIYVPTTPLPTSGYMLLIPEEDVVEIDWDLNQTLQAVISGGMSVPLTVHYQRTDRPAIKGGSPAETPSPEQKPATPTDPPASEINKPPAFTHRPSSSPPTSD